MGSRTPKGTHQIFPPPLYIVEYSSPVQFILAVEEKEESFHYCVECEVPRKLLLHSDQLMPPLDIGFERFEENNSQLNWM